MAGFDVAVMKDLGIGIIALFFLYMIIRSQMTTQVTQQNATNKVLQENSKSINKLANALEKGNLLDEEFRRSMIDSQKESRDMILDIQGKVDDIHEKVV